MNDKICISIGEMPFLTCLKLVSTYPLVEIRLDLLKLTSQNIDALSMQSRQWIATCRPCNLAERERTVMLAASIRAGATYVDIEYEAEPNYRQTLIDLAKSRYCKIIISYHNFDTTPDIDTLNQIIRDSKEMGADYVKLAVTANTYAHCARIMSLYEHHDNIIAFAMGEVGKITRIAAPLLGAQFTFASIDETHKTAPAQMTVQEMEAVYNILSGKIIEIKAFSQDIYQFARKLTTQLTGGTKTLSEDAFRAILESPNSHLFVIYDTDGTPAGMLTVGIYSTVTGSKAWIEDVTVDETCRGRGYGKKIVEHAIEFIRRSGVETISLTSNPSRVAANRLYQKLGFEEYETNVYKTDN